MDSKSKLISLVFQIWGLYVGLLDSDSVSKLISLITQAISLVISMDFDSQPESELKSLTTQAICLFNSLDLDSQPDPLKKLISLFSQKLSLVNSTDLDSEPDSKLMELIVESIGLKPHPELISLIFQILSHVISVYTEPKPDPEPEIISFITQLISEPISLSLKIDLILEIISMVNSMDFDSEPMTELMSLISQTISLFHSMDLDSQPDPLKNLISLISQRVLLVNFIDSNSEPESEPEPGPIFASHYDEILEMEVKPVRKSPHFQKLCSVNDVDDLISFVGQTLKLEPEPEFISLIYQIFSLVISMNIEWKKLIFVCPQVQVKLEKGKFHVIDEEVSWSSNDKWKCLPLNWNKFGSTEEGVSRIRCPTCNGKNHGEYEKAPVEIKHTLHPKHSLQLVLLNGDGTKECYCCDKDLKEVFYYCSACDYAMNIACVEKPRVLSIDHPKWHEHTLAQFPRKASLTCSVCALSHSSCSFYICPPCDFVVHQKCTSLPRVIRISRHFHRIYFTPSFDQRIRCCGVCRRKIDNDYGGYSCNKDGCLYAAHSKCATQSNVWDGKELEGEPEEDIKEIEPFVTVRDGVIRHFSHQHHHLKLDENTGRDYDENKLCQACITPIYFGNLYSCMQCDFILHEECAKLSRKIHHPIHPHLLTLVGRSDLVMDATKSCSICPWRCTTGFFYECSERECRFKVHVQCATISEPLVHESHMHPLFLTSKPGEERRCCVCKELGHCYTNETFNCIECDFALCFQCATLPQKVRYKHDKHMLTLSYGEKKSTMTYWCEVCEKKINPKERFYMCDKYCCVTLHIECMLGMDLYMKPGSFWLYRSSKVSVLPNNHHMSRPICSFCEKRCPHKIVFQCFGLISCSTSCIRVKDFLEMGK